MLFFNSQNTSGTLFTLLYLVYQFGFRVMSTEAERQNPGPDRVPEMEFFNGILVKVSWIFVMILKPEKNMDSAS